ncbi:MAG: aminotransferase class V-fold PLP-dependent enzyme [Chitinophagaceae bacterium]|nr:aminotransferase class V-fold PLP-dependent enzyme [Anaerolineae bacterium]
MTLELSPEEFRKLGYRAIDALAEQLAAFSQPESPARRPVPDDVRQRIFNQVLPEEGQSPEALLERVFTDVLPYPMGNNSPRFFAWVNSPAAPLSILAELLAAGVNPSVAGGDHAATYVEHAVLNWLKTIMRFPASGGGILTSGGSVANLIGLAVMRHVKITEVRRLGMAAESQEVVIYTSAQGHSCIQKAVELLGFGSESLRHIPVDADFRMDMNALREQIKLDRAQNKRPICVVASAGTVNTGAIDPLDEIAALCREENLWFHIDGAYGAVGILSDQANMLYSGIEQADSLALDPHKWLYVPVECGCALVRDAQAMRDAFSLLPPYLRDDRALPWFAEFGIQQTRGFKALKLWLVMQQIGVDGYRKSISRDIELARALRERIRNRADFMLVSDGPLSITCFRYTPPHVPEEKLDDLNRQLLALVQQEGHVFITGTILNERQVIRACIVNFRTQESDLDFLLEVLAEAGQRLLSENV